MADETTKELSGDNLSRLLLERVDQMFVQQQRLYDQQQQLHAQQQETNARLIKVEAFVDERIYDTRPRLDLLLKEVADLKNHDLPQLRQDLRQEMANVEARLMQQITPLQQRSEDIYEEGRKHARQLKTFRDELWEMKEARVELEERVEVLERMAA